MERAEALSLMDVMSQYNRMGCVRTRITLAARLSPGAASSSCRGSVLMPSSGCRPSPPYSLGGMVAGGASTLSLAMFPR